jgi:GH15 family glucan-1,4-alpha-glucosidase
MKRALLILAMATTAHAASPVNSISALTTGNGFGFAVFDLKAQKISQFLERPYRFLRPGASMQSLGVERRNLAYDLYFGVRAGATASWMKDTAQTEVGYVAESNIIRTAGTVGGVKVESYFLMPFGFSGNGVIALVHVTNNNAGAVNVDTFLNPNFHMGSGTGDVVGSENETITTTGIISTETGPGGGAMIYQPFGFDKADCSGTGYSRVMGGMDLAGTPQSCTNQSDVTIVFQKSLGSIAAGGDAWWGAAISFVADGNTTNGSAAMSTWINSRTPPQILSDAQSEFENWRKPPPSGLSSDETKIYRQAESVLRMAQILEPWSDSPKHKAYGMLLASLPPGVWHIGWVRDAQYATVALARMGHLDEAKRALEWILNAEANLYQSYAGVPYRVSVTRYFGDGTEESDWNADGPNIEFDGWGLYLWAARTYIDRAGLSWLDGKTRANEPIYDVLRDQIALPIQHNQESGGLIGKDTSIWESHWNNRKHYTFTSLAAARGLCDFASLAERHADPSTAATYRAAAAALKTAIRTNLVDSTVYLGGSQEGIAAGKYHDGAAIEAFNWELYPQSDGVWKATLDGISPLQVGSGGYKRNDDNGSSYDNDEWVMIDLRVSAAMRRNGRTQRADDLLGWVTSQAAANQNLLPELYNQTNNALPVNGYSGSIPMVGFGAAAYVNTLLDRAGASPEQRDCDPMMSFGDGGGEVPDLSTPQGSDGGSASDMAILHPMPKTPETGCGCGVGGCATSAPLGLLVLLLLFRRKRAKGQ